MTKRTEVIVTLKHVPNYMVTRRAAQQLDAPTVTTRKSLRDAETATKEAKRTRLSDEGAGATMSELTYAPKVTIRRSLAASSKATELQSAFDETQKTPSAPMVTDRKHLSEVIFHPGTKSYTAILVVNEDGSTPAGFDVADKDETYDVPPLYFTSMKALQTHLDNVRRFKSSYSVSGGILIQERDTTAEGAPTQLEKITINNQEDLARAIASLTVVKVDAALAVTAAAAASSRGFRA